MKNLLTITRPSYTLLVELEQDLFGDDLPVSPILSPKDKAEWCAALRSGTYPQTQKKLHIENQGYCCLGVLCELHKLKSRSVPFEFENGSKLVCSVYASPDPDSADASEAQLPKGFFPQLGVEGTISPPFSVRLFQNNSETNIRSLADLNDEGVLFEDIATVIELCF